MKPSNSSKPLKMVRGSCIDADFVISFGEALRGIILKTETFIIPISS